MTPHETNEYEAATSGSDNRQQESVLWYYLSVIRRRIWVILPVFVVVATFGVLRAVRATPVFRARAKVMVERQNQQLMRFGGAGDEGRDRDAEYFMTQIELLSSHAVMASALEEPGVREIYETSGGETKPSGLSGLLKSLRRTLLSMLGAQPVAAPETWELLRDEIRATHLENTHMIHVEVLHADPYRAALLANAAAEAYQKYHRQKKTDTLSEAFTSLQKERDKQELQLFEAEKSLQDFRQSAQAVSVGESNEDQPAVDRLVRLNEQLTDVQLRRIELTAQIGVMRKVVSLEKGVSGASLEELFALPIIQDDVTLTESRRALAESAKEAAVLAETYGTEHPLLRSARAKVTLLETQFKTALDEAIRAHQNQVSMLETEEAELKRKAEEQKRVALDLAKESFTLTRLQGAVDRHRRLLDAIVERMREVDISSGLVKTNVQVIEQAATPTVPVNSAKVRSIIISLFAACVMGIGVALVFENLDDSIKTPEDLKQALSVPLLGFVPAMGREVRPRARRAKGNGGPTIQGQDRKGRAGKNLYKGSVVLSEPTSSVAEAYRNLRTNLLYSTAARDARLLVLTSCRPQEGKSTTSTNLALALARTGKRVLLIDGDLHRPTTHRVLGLDANIGLSDVLAGDVPWEQAIKQVHTEDGQVVQNLFALPSGSETPDPSELIGSDGMKQLLETCRARYDWVLVDTPPILFVSDACTFSALCDGVVVVVKSGVNTRTVLNRAREQLESINARIVGSVLNCMVTTRLGRHHSYYSYHGYTRYAKDYHRAYYGKKKGQPEDSVA